jgi:hypothetical protein
MSDKNLITIAKTYFQQLESIFAKSCKKLKVQEQLNLDLAGNNITIKTAGDTLQSFVCRALLHLPQVTSPDIGLEIMVWDELDSNIHLPQPPNELFVHPNGKKYSQNTLDGYFIIYYENKTIFHLYDLEANRAIVCIRDVHKLPNYFLAAPFFEVFKLWSKKSGFNILHAGCIANNEHAIIIVGKGGMGKSTTSIQSLIGGLNYLSDDYVLVKFGDNPMAYSIFCSGKLHTDHLKNFPTVSKIAFNKNEEIYDKPLMFLNEIYPDQIQLQSPIKAIIAPQLNNEKESFFESLSSFEALKALAPSTILQLRLGNNMDLKIMADFTKSTKCFKLFLGRDLNGIPPIVNELLKSLN